MKLIVIPNRKALYPCLLVEIPWQTDQSREYTSPDTQYTNNKIIVVKTNLYGNVVFSNVKTPGRIMILEKQAGAELGQAQLKLGLVFKICYISLHTEDAIG